ncbi:hypothetical protein [Actinocrinis sp.]|uniref:hypothetical protein n=1 Tax=Actinocrinis sp. TaxID=1920516 RepID=UPI002D4BBDF4|nr:hypothetical protein [Actinocrinis sp.]HZP49960.1 hypothetical protein [Actinocrinis sp.]
MAGTEYRLTVVNNSTNYVDLCVYQSPPDLGVPDVNALAWLAEPAHPTTTVHFRWTIDYSFVWSNNGELAVGSLFDASQDWPADPYGKTAPQQAQLSYLNGAYTFDEGAQPVPTPQPGNLYIHEDATIPLREASVGVGMSGAGTFAVVAQPNQNLMFTPHPEYWITAGVFTAGQVIDEEQISDKAAVAFPPGVFSMLATLNPDNSWTVQPD